MSLSARSQFLFLQTLAASPSSRLALHISDCCGAHARSTVSIGRRPASPRPGPPLSRYRYGRPRSPVHGRATPAKITSSSGSSWGGADDRRPSSTRDRPDHGRCRARPPGVGRSVPVIARPGPPESVGRSVGDVAISGEINAVDDLLGSTRRHHVRSSTDADARAG